ncbi:hypothetical protein GCM10011376_14290 [Nocardioides flavus (ex Wang et al. 2016)]|uniref:Uncharacterized protein n=1 Tax=Nocardioides flavus (ex Wang et al. 2016) TaxID=2058780 RepID=A0ABQ3HKZ0_9ACTN|nr:hypothetical protein [Nocardioides flavus (ex Wang et al. 2016)]GHE16819.1 hypothetical protein GCM10011376_14290 [Nocardioides flavus (ex Wang et al. 2016)]
MTDVSDSAVDRSSSVEVPVSAWALAWSFVVGQVLELAQRGPQSADAWPLSILLGVALVTYVSHGVLRARPVRFWLVALLLALALVTEVIAVVDTPTGWTVTALALTVLQVALLHRFAGSPWFELQRRRASGGPTLAPILLVAALTGALGGVLGAEDDMVPTQERYGHSTTELPRNPVDGFA